MTQASISDTTLEVKRTINAGTDAVYRAFTDAKQLEKWYAPGDMSATVHHVEPKVGGTYKIDMGEKDGSVHTSVGKFLELVPGKKIVMEFNWEGANALPENGVVTVTLDDAGAGKTLVTLKHERLPNAEATQMHAQGWEGCLENLAKVF